ncbi:MAG: hypothetical protein HN736_12595 [Anaerolineae bacterium]|jgi:GAF domain-containing protein|nr:hypothetical protein [Anaerolineae bacterium]MBT3713105.1 hypothetical protein [Anaerolineae bacterium]MBT4310536.1 hypothetical protein [Anaerolineae bacterium]MBT4457405.1 hypothetical protein [Anaerolineae bacterium]MBT6060467.1 hypothetical protein [Anaerolineae bacterium]
MADTDKTKIQLLDDLADARQRIFELEEDESKRVQMKNAIQKQMQAQVALRNAGAAISSSLSMETVMNQIVEELGKAVDATSADINHFDLTSGVTTVIAEYIGSEANAAEKASDLHTVYPDPGADDIVFWQREKRMKAGQHDVAHADDANLTSFERVDVQEYGVKSKLYIPLLVRDEFYGYA